jgi:hypothetical protein
MKSIKQIIAEAGDKHSTEQLMPEFLASYRGNLVVVKAILNLTAVVYPPQQVHETAVARLDEVMVRPHLVKWVPRSKEDIRIRLAYKRGFRLSQIAKRENVRARV